MFFSDIIYRIYKNIINKITLTMINHSLILVKTLVMTTKTDLFSHKKLFSD